MNLSELNPYIRLAIHSILSPDHVLHRRVIFDYELLYVERGCFRLRYGNGVYLCEKGTVLLLRPGVPHSFHCLGEELSQPHIHFDLIYNFESEQIPISFRDEPQMTPVERSYVRKDLLGGDPTDPILRVTDLKAFLRCFYRVIDCPNTPAGHLLRRSAMLELLAILFEELFADCASPTPIQQVEEQIKHFIDAGQGMQMSLRDFERQFSYDRFYLERRFKQAYGTGLISYRNQRRMELARLALQNDSVTEIAKRMGYKSIYAFSRAFKQYFGFCPSEVGKKK
ncbi:MAG: helix-turn-helix domain-containing protein [Ruminococcaceae bacterium]|nr:helix-turn-helix domain-containing protein [Oscillospiraceae bacterium]